MDFFFDSWGQLHTPCSGHTEGAGAFGPTGISRPATAAEADLLVLPGETPATAAERAGRFVPGGDEGGFAHLCTGGTARRVDIALCLHEARARGFSRVEAALLKKWLSE